MFKMSKQELELSQAARDLQKNPAYKNAFNDVEEHYLKLWKETNIKDKEEREILYMAIRLLKEVKSHIEIRVSEGDAYIKQVDKDVLKFKKGVK